MYFTAPDVWGKATTVTASGGTWGSARWAKRSCGNAKVYFLNARYSATNIGGNSWNVYSAYKLPDGITIPRGSTNTFYTAAGCASDGAVRVDVACTDGNITCNVANLYSSAVSADIVVSCLLIAFS